MTTAKQSTSKVTPLPMAGRATRPARRSTTARHASAGVARESRRAPGASAYAIPAAAMVASGLIAAGAFVLKDRLGDMVAEALKRVTAEGSAAAGVTHNLTAAARDNAHAGLERLIRAAGLERQRPLRSILVPSLGVACGFVVGALLTHLFAPKLLARLGIQGAPMNDVGTPRRERVEPQPDVTAGVDGVKANGAARPIVG